MSSQTLRICPKGHRYYKSSDCPTCPQCENENKPQTGFLALLPAPARRALLNEGITTLKKLATYSEKDLLQFHGFGKASIPILSKVLKKEKLTFKSITQ